MPFNLHCKAIAALFVIPYCRPICGHCQMWHLSLSTITHNFTHNTKSIVYVLLCCFFSSLIQRGSYEYIPLKWQLEYTMQKICFLKILHFQNSIIKGDSSKQKVFYFGKKKVLATDLSVHYPWKGERKKDVVSMSLLQKQLQP